MGYIELGHSEMVEHNNRLLKSVPLKNPQQCRFWECMDSHFCVFLADKGAGLQKCFCCICFAPLYSSPQGVREAAGERAQSAAAAGRGFCFPLPPQRCRQHWPQSSIPSLANDHQLKT